MGTYLTVWLGKAFLRKCHLNWVWGELSHMNKPGRTFQLRVKDKGLRQERFGCRVKELWGHFSCWGLQSNWERKQARFGGALWAMSIGILIEVAWSTLWNLKHRSDLCSDLWLKKEHLAFWVEKVLKWDVPLCVSCTIRWGWG